MPGFYLASTLGCRPATSAGHVDLCSHFFRTFLVKIFLIKNISMDFPGGLLKRPLRNNWLLDSRISTPGLSSLPHHAGDSCIFSNMQTIENNRLLYCEQWRNNRILKSPAFWIVKPWQVCVVTSGTSTKEQHLNNIWAELSVRLNENVFE